MNAERVFLMMIPNKELEFEYIQNATVTSSLNLKNVHTAPVAFKVRTTAPKSYLVRPSQGILYPGEAKELSIIMQPLSEHPGDVAHRFLVQAIPTQLNPSTCSSQDLNDIWTNAKEGSQNTKLSVKILDEQRVFQPRPTVYIDPVENQPKPSVEKIEEIKKQIKEQANFNAKLEEKSNELEAKLKKLNEEQKRKEFDPKRVGTETADKGFGLFHILMCLVAGIILGYLSSVNRNY
ncbi:unnamed protein product [Blepharisma stoltei]|uniref:MSP domain-containing protein n=1 Tax=Blepharisma stoltei TaxID=1481888 RepID=A0AAU9IDA9_9CILI|nr:unnamed protein product [Blepharisma stoltei]